jgi:hypothetical protein
MTEQPKHASEMSDSEFQAAMVARGWRPKLEPVVTGTAEENATRRTAVLAMSQADFDAAMRSKAYRN